MYQTRNFLATLQATEAVRENAFSRDLREAMIAFFSSLRIYPRQPPQAVLSKSKKETNKNLRPELWVPHLL
jgi:hypothetical protein